MTQIFVKCSFPREARNKSIWAWGNENEVCSVGDLHVVVAIAAVTTHILEHRDIRPQPSPEGSAGRVVINGFQNTNYSNVFQNIFNCGEAEQV